LKQMSTHISAEATVRPYGTLTPKIGDDVVIMEGVRVIGDITLGNGVSLWYNTVIRGDVHWVRIGEDTNVQDNSVLHVTHDRFPLLIGARVTVGHAARLHGCTIEDETLIGIAATVLDGAVVRASQHGRRRRRRPAGNGRGNGHPRGGRTGTSHPTAPGR
jgi:carbonic anhydrase/acetyltransferase-like protein (isoleucine patch superfamily)